MVQVSELIKKVVKSFNKHYPLSAVIFLALVVFSAYWQLVNLYFWTDDWDLFLKVAHPELGLWGMDPGWFGSGPYRYLHTPFMPFFPFFGLNAAPYFAGEIITYFIATISVFLLALEVVRKKSVALGIATIYGSLGYIGSYTLFHLSNTFQNVGAVIFTTLTLWILAKYYRTRKPIFYLLSIFLFYASLEIENLRAHGLIFLVFGLTLLYARWRKSFSTIAFNILSLIPFVLIYKALYSATIGSGSSTTVGAFFYTMTRDKLYAYFIYPFASFCNVIIPDDITKFIYSSFGSDKGNIIPEILLVMSLIFIAGLIYVRNKKYKFILAGIVVLEVLYFIFNRWALNQPILFTLDSAAGFISMLGMTMLLLCLLASAMLWEKRSIFSKSILLGIILIFGHYIGYFIGIPSYSFLATTDRYLTPSTVGTAVLLGSLFYLAYFKKKHLFVILTVIYCAYLIVVMNFTINKVVTEISNPTKKLYKNIMAITPSIPDSSVLFLDFENNPNLKYQVNSSFPNTAFALFYKKGNRLPSMRSFEEYLSLVKENKMKIEDLLSYYISQWEVVETSKKVHFLLKNPAESSAVDISNWRTNTDFSADFGFLSVSPFILEREKDSVGVSPRLEGVINYQSVVPAILSFTLTATPVNFEGKKFPFYDVSSQMPDELIKEDLKDIDIESIKNNGLPCKEIPVLLKLDRERKEFVKIAKIETSSQAGYSEKEFLTDGNFETNWTGHVLHWSTNKKEEILIDLGQEKNINKLIWVNYLRRPAPVEYEILVSKDEKNWIKVKEVRNGPARIEGEFVVDQFGNQDVRFVKMVITNTFANLTPSIAEIWVSSINEGMPVGDYIQQLVDYPLLCPVDSSEQYGSLNSILNSVVNAKFWWLANSRENYNKSYSKNLEIIADGLPHIYNVYIPAQGTILEKVMISDFQLPLDISIGNVSVRSLSFEEIDSLGLITKSAAPSH